MITPLMLILSCLNEDYEMDKPVNILYLSKADRDIIFSETRRLCEMVLDENVIATMDDHVFPMQYSGDNSVTLDAYTIAFLDRVRACAKLCQKSLQVKTTSTEQDNDEDLSDHSTILTLEGNPEFIYFYVYKLMEREKSLSYSAKVEKLANILTMLGTYSGTQLDDTSETACLMKRLELHSNISYWKGMLMGDIMRRTHDLPEHVFTVDTIHTIRKQIEALGLYGFVNPLQMYKDFNASRVGRKSSVNIDSFVIEFLCKIVQSGGGRLQIENNY